MTVSVTKITLNVSTTDEQIARFAACAIVLAVIESGIPSPIPGFKPGLANIVTLIALQRLGWSAAAWVSMLRILGSSLVLGGVFSPGFALSLAGGVASVLALALVQYLPRRYFGLVTWSLCSAVAHLVGQLLIARLWLIPHNGILVLIPLLLAMAIIFGVVNGLIATHLLRTHPAVDTTQ
ncbi:Gx transporter family protein [uncultured Deefgea sp.]|uniref:Gx transporter family protein n=1 Tax=uncultured Deefgea sp. TaxID=1304914 RepID=UPI0026198482|nr:Gx transporter family protein [uncultured Deefgea sp.]